MCLNKWKATDNSYFENMLVYLHACMLASDKDSEQKLHCMTETLFQQKDNINYRYVTNFHLKLRDEQLVAITWHYLWRSNKPTSPKHKN